MRTNIVLNETLVTEAMRLAGIKTRREMVERALEEYVARHQQRELLKLAGKDLIDPGYDVRRTRAGMSRGTR